MSFYGRHGEAPLPVLAASSPADCYWMSINAAKIAIKYMTPVILLTDGYLALGSEPLRIPEISEIPEIPVNYRKDPEGFYPYLRDENGARPWAVPGTPNLEHRIGGLEKKDVFGNISYEPLNHEIMINNRDKKVKNVVNDIPDVEVKGLQEGDLLVLSWGSTLGPIHEALRRINKNGPKVSHVHLSYLNPFPKNLGEVLKKFKRILIPELNLGQLAFIIRSKYLIDVIQYNKVQGQTFKSIEIENEVNRLLGGKDGK